MLEAIRRLLQQLGGALVFYTIVPLPSAWPLDFQRIARWAPWIGLLVGVLLAGTNFLLLQIPLSSFLRGVLVLVVWIAITGGLHLDGAIDTADGLAVPDPARRLAVMSDSRTGAYGAIAAIVLILLKVGAIADLSSPQACSVLILAPIWGRWGQLVAIARYPYLKAEGKGAFHRCSLQLPQDLWPSLLLLAAIGIIPVWLGPDRWVSHLGQFALGSILSWSVGAWFYRRLRGMTGDSYGAIVEWTEALLTCCLSIAIH
ncbi:adenosylcobinamide-GDP ribazoletransferase [Altericista sp. CCNU0014]|uniref:adenosylcobinamide-GDP ribazoletransferase n=1 Tax=Altericista sp. CCNU0014 TaxID=3082949 RepID=UPI00384AAF57